MLDLGCGWGHFINRVNAQHKFGLDLNPASRSRLDPSVTFYEQRADSAWPLADDSLDVVFTSNFFEHLPNRGGISSALSEAHRALRPGGTIVCLGPNIRFTGGAYWDFFDHHVPLTDRSLGEALQLAGFSIESSIDRFLPYTMAGKPPPPSVAIRAYLRLRPAWRLLGKRFLLTASARKTVRPVDLCETIKEVDQSE